jgi:hypothetical protein
MINGTAYFLKTNNSSRAMPESATVGRILQLVRRRKGESIGFDNGGEIALILGPDGETVASWVYDQR